MSEDSCSLLRCFKKKSFFFQAVFNCPDNLDGDVHTKVREILPELNKILDKTSFYPYRLFICALLKSLGTCFTAACIAIVIQLLFLGRLALKAVEEPYLSPQR